MFSTPVNPYVYGAVTFLPTSIRDFNMCVSPVQRPSGSSLWKALQAGLYLSRLVGKEVRSGLSRSRSLVVGVRKLYSIITKRVYYLLIMIYYHDNISSKLSFIKIHIKT